MIENNPIFMVPNSPDSYNPHAFPDNILFIG